MKESKIEGVFSINKLGRNFLSVGIVTLLSQILTFLTVTYLARVLSIDYFGKVSLVQSIIVYFSMFTLFGLQTFGTREISKDCSKCEEMVSNVTAFRTIIAFFGFLIVIIIGSISGKGIEFRNLLILYGITILPLAWNIDWFFSGIYEMHHNAVYNLLKNAVPFLLTIVFIKSKEQIYYLPIFTLLGISLGVIYQAYIYKVKKGYKYKPYINKSIFKKYLILGSPFLFSGILSMINCNVDSIMIGFIKGENELGLYSSAYKIIFFLTNLIAILFSVVYPMLTKYFQDIHKEKLQGLYKGLSKIIVFFAVPLCVGGLLLSKEIVVFLFGQKYFQAYIPLRILVVYIMILFMRELYAYSLNAWNKEKTYLKIIFGAAVINLILNGIFIPIFGMTGAAAVTLVSEIFTITMMSISTRKIAKSFYVKEVVRDLPCLIIMSIVIIIMKFFKVHLLLIIGSAIIVYFTAAILFKYIIIRDIKSTFS